MNNEELVPDANICQWLFATKWTTKTHYAWRKYSLQSKPMLLPDDTGEQLKTMVASGKEEWRYPAPTVRELIEQIPQDITIERSEHGWYVSIMVALDQSLFQLKSTLEEALACLWIALQKIKEL